MSYADIETGYGYPKAITLKTMTYGSTSVRTAGKHLKKSDIR